MLSSLNAKTHKVQKNIKSQKNIYSRNESGKYALKKKEEINEKLDNTEFLQELKIVRKPVNNDTDNNPVSLDDINTYLGNSNDDINNSKNSEIIFGYARNITCSESNCNLPNTCIDDKTCKCAIEFAEYELNRPREENEAPAILEDDLPYCNYKKRSKLIYFMMEFFFAFGFGHFYAKNIKMGILKLLLIFLPCLIIFLAVFYLIESSRKSEQILGLMFVFIFIITCSFCVWWLVDIVMISFGHYTDGNGVPLNPW